ncbi:MAG: hypothetical protein GTN36_05030 [Candidatus Aenigmarchaeota archaeon]|nr:hypothetical protein [Candidatus Aenigmarchaeota archaeon]
MPKIFLSLLAIIIGIILTCLKIFLTNDKREVSPTEAKENISNDYYDYILDVRSSNEWNSGHLQQAKFVPVTELEAENYSRLENIPKNSRILVHCRSGVRAKRAANILNKLGYKYVDYLKGGYEDLA